MNAARIAGLLAEEGLDWAVLAGPEAVAFATGHVPAIETGPSPFAGGPTLALVGRDGGVGILAANVEGEQAPSATYHLYEGFAGRVTDVGSNHLAALHDLMGALGVGGRIGADRRHLPLVVSEALTGRVADLTAPLDRLRAVKTPREHALLAAAARIASLGQHTAREATAEGRSELEVLSAIRGAMETAAGVRCALAGEYLAGVAHTATLGTPPGARRIAVGDPVICDLAPRVGGYWADSCGSFTVGHAPESYEAMWRAARKALALGMAELRPGLRVDALDALVRGHVRSRGFDYPHHTGHGVGCGVHEWPRIVPDETAAIEEGMVLMLEPGAYVPGLGGVRCEHMLEVTATGCRALTEFPLDPGPV